MLNSLNFYRLGIMNFWNIDVKIVFVNFCNILTNFCFTLEIVKESMQLILIFYKN